MSFGKATTPRFPDTSPKVEAPGTTNAICSNSSANVNSERSSQTARIPICKSRSRSLGRPQTAGSSTLSSVTTADTAKKSKIPIQNCRINALPAKNALNKKNLSQVDKNKKSSQSTTACPSSEIKSIPSASTAKNKLPQHNIVAGVKSSPNTATNSAIRPQYPYKGIQTVLTKKRPASSDKEIISPTGKKEPLKVPDPSLSNQKKSNQVEDERINKYKNYVGERKLFEKITLPKEASFDLENLKHFVNSFAQGSTLFCSQIIDNWKTVLVNLINNYIDSENDELQNEKLAKYLEEGDGIHQKYNLLKTSQNEISEKILNMVTDLLTETLSLRTLSKDFGTKLESFEIEYDDINKQIKAFLEELEAEKIKTSDLNEHKIQLEQKIKKYMQRLKVLEDKSQTFDAKISQQSTLLKSYESRLKQKDEKYQLLEKGFNHQVKLGKIAMEIKEKLEKQRESLESRVNYLRKVRTDQQNENIKSMNSITSELNNALKELEEVKNQKNNLEKELKETHERLMLAQEKNLESANVTEVNKTVIMNEVSLAFSEKEEKLNLELKEAQFSLEKTKEERDFFKAENKNLQTKIAQILEQTTDKNNVNDPEPKLIDDLKTELINKDELIEKLKKQVEVCLHDIEERDSVIKEFNQKQIEQTEEIVKSTEPDEKESLKCEIQQLKRQLEDSETKNKNLLQQLSHKQSEVEQREKVIHEQAKVLHVRDELLKLLQQKDRAKVRQLRSLQDRLDHHKHNADMSLQNNKVSSSKAEQMQELYSTLETKQRRVLQLEEEIRNYKTQKEHEQNNRARLEARITELEMALSKKAGLSSIASNYISKSPDSSQSSAAYQLNINNHLWNNYSQDKQNSTSSKRASEQNQYPHLKSKFISGGTNKSLIQLYKVNSTCFNESDSSQSNMLIPFCWPSKNYNKVKGPGQQHTLF